MISLFEQILTIKGYPIARAKQLLNELQKMSLDEQYAWQQKKRKEILLHHYNTNEFYRNFVGTVLPERWEELPILTKKDLQKPLSKIVAKGTDLKRCYKGSTSGSTGTPFTFAKDKFTHAMTWAVIADKYAQYGITLQSKQARFYGQPKEFIANRKELLKDKMMNRDRFNVFDLSDNSLEKYRERFQKKKFDYIYGYTSALVSFARYLNQQHIVLKTICPTLKLCICTSETCSLEDKRILEKGFGITVVREYGLSETCITAFDTPNVGWEVNENTLYTEVVDGQIVTTSLFNTAMPMLRYATGDMGEIDDRDNSGSRQLKALTGRTNDMILLSNGRKAAGLSFYYVARAVLEKTDALQEFIVRQTAVDKFEFDVLSTRALTEEEQQLLKTKTQDYLSAEVDVVIYQVEKIQRPESGKLKHFYSQVSE